MIGRGARVLKCLYSCCATGVLALWLNVAAPQAFALEVQMACQKKDGNYIVAFDTKTLELTVVVRSWALYMIEDGRDFTAFSN